ncbi:hypothetical protein ABS71_05490 [bacterium SCN 62-11]|nr:hypothetical protein [Candidatus Eremiobacteraeota bacterium]ODT74561.1 MAG: hypothetical protein ABS71_05490 [bacterium SCN 62-11]
MQLSIARNFEVETPQQRDAHRQARRIQLDVELAASALSQADNGKSDRNPASESVDLSDAYVRHHEAYGYNHFSKLTGTMEKAEGQLVSLDAKGVHQYEWLELSPPACQPYQMGHFDLSYRREGEEEVFRSGGRCVRVNAAQGTLTLTD